MRMRIIFVFAILLGLTRTIWAGDAEEKAVCPVTGKSATSDTAKCPFVGDAEVLNNANCPVQGNPVDGKTFTIYGGKVYGFCCPDCISKFKSDPEQYISTMSNEKSETN